MFQNAKIGLPMLLSYDKICIQSVKAPHDNATESRVIKMMESVTKNVVSQASACKVKNLFSEIKRIIYSFFKKSLLKKAYILIHLKVSTLLYKIKMSHSLTLRGGVKWNLETR